MLNHQKTVLQIINEQKTPTPEAALRSLGYGRDIVLIRPGIDHVEFGSIMFLAGMNGRLQPPSPSALAEALRGTMLGRVLGAPPLAEEASEEI